MHASPPPPPPTSPSAARERYYDHRHPPPPRLFSSAGDELRGFFREGISRASLLFSKIPICQADFPIGEHSGGKGGKKYERYSWRAISWIFKKRGGNAERSRKRRQKEEAFRTPRPDVTPLFAQVFWREKLCTLIWDMEMHEPPPPPPPPPPFLSYIGAQKGAWRTYFLSPAAPLQAGSKE